MNCPRHHRRILISSLRWILAMQRRGTLARGPGPTLVRGLCTSSGGSHRWTLGHITGTITGPHSRRLLTSPHGSSATRPSSTGRWIRRRSRLSRWPSSKPSQPQLPAVQDLTQELQCWVRSGHQRQVRTCGQQRQVR